jgi:glutaredoxin
VNEVGAVVLAAVLVLCAAAAWWLRTRDGAVRAGNGREDRSGAVPVLRRLGARPEDADLTVVQFSTATCAACRSTEALLERLRAGRPGLAVVHVAAEEHLDAVRELGVRRTPTLFYVDRAGALVGRSSGAPRPDELAVLVGARTGTVPEART